MPVDWPLPDAAIDLGGGRAHKIDPRDGRRQQATVRAILERLRTQPGVVLADEVGMGKTYVALGVVASVLLASRDRRRPVIVMTPPGLAGKWPREWRQFRTLCAVDGSLDWVRSESVQSPAHFFQLIGSPPSKRPHLVWMTTGCFSQGLRDPLIKLAFIRLARGHTKLSESARGALHKWAPSLTQTKSWLDWENIEWLLGHKPSQWQDYLVRKKFFDREDPDAVPEALLRAAHRLDFGDWEGRPGLATLLRNGTIPGKSGPVSSETEADARREINEACQRVYWQWIRKADWRAPLLVLDEAHHAKNDETRLASLFRGEDEEELGLLSGKFDRMLFLTATPFQLGHQELIRVLRSFRSVQWKGDAAPSRSPEDFDRALVELEKRLDLNRQAGRQVDRLWGRLTREQVEARSGIRGDLAAATEEWWRLAGTSPADAFEAELVKSLEHCRRTLERAREDPEGDPWRSLRTWVIRHNRPETLPAREGSSDIPRRERRAGEAILGGEGKGSGIRLSGTSALPFLLAARAQGELAGGSVKARAFFAEGLASSYEAFHHTREERVDVRDVDDDGLPNPRKDRRRHRVASNVPLEWYEKQIAQLIPSKTSPKADLLAHPKLGPVVRRAVEHWMQGEKVLIFCFYRQTVSALNDHLKAAVSEAILSTAARKLGLEPGDAGEARDWLARIARRMGDEKSPFRKVILDELRLPFQEPGLEKLARWEDQLVDVLAAYVRSPSFIARYLPLDIPAVRSALSEGETRGGVIREGTAALLAALRESRDASGVTLGDRLREFLLFAKDLAEHAGRSTEGEHAGEEEPQVDPLEEYIRGVATFFKTQKLDDDDESEGRTRSGGYRAPRVVRKVSGETPRSVRENVMLAFNSPLFPEILVSSAVLGEGVDLHRFCRHVIHHDLCWNPSTLEQRTGRLDRIRCKAEQAHRPIVIYEPFIGGSADEKMFRVVRDRERWFQIVMGQKFEFSEAEADAIASRVPLPDSIASGLVFDLSCWKQEDPAGMAARDRHPEDVDGKESGTTDTSSRSVSRTLKP